MFKVMYIATLEAMKESNGRVTFFSGIRRLGVDLEPLETDPSKKLHVNATTCLPSAIDKFIDMNTMFCRSVNIDNAFQWLVEKDYVSQEQLDQAIEDVKLVKGLDIK